MAADPGCVCSRNEVDWSSQEESSSPGERIKTGLLKSVKSSEDNWGNHHGSTPSKQKQTDLQNKSLGHCK